MKKTGDLNFAQQKPKQVQVFKKFKGSNGLNF